MSEVVKFHILAQIFISFIGAVLLLAIWYNIRKRFKQILEEDDSQKRVDKGLLHLSSAMFVWVISGIWAFTSFAFDFHATTTYQVGVSLLSTLNNLFLLLALFYFSYGPKFIYHNKKNINKIIVLIIVIAAATIILGQLFGESNIRYGLKISGIPDLLLSAFLSLLLAIAFYRTFINRDLQIVAFISVGAILLMFISQLPEVFLSLDDGFNNNLIKIIAKTSLIGIFLVLATSWVIRLASMPKPNEMTLKFMDWSLVKISIPSKGVFDQTIDFGSKTTQYRNLFKFAIRRKYGDGQSQSIMINPGGEIKNQTYLSRIIENINEILQLENDQKLERRDLFTFIGHGHYRLRMIPENITIDETLLQEFTQNPENQTYKAICN